MASDVVDEVDRDAACAGVGEITVETEGAEVALEFLCEEGGGDAAAGVTAAVGAEEDDVVVGTGAGVERVGLRGGSEGEGGEGLG